MKIRLAIGLILIAALSRLLPHPPNFTPIAAIGLLGAAYFKREWMAYLIPFAALFLSNVILNHTIYAADQTGTDWVSMGWTYFSFGVLILAGRKILFENVRPLRILGASLSASVLFFLVSNFGVWQFSVGYPKTFAGLMTCYTAGVPFFGYTLLGDLFYTTVLFGAFAIVFSKIQARQIA